MKRLQFQKDIKASAEKVYNTMLGIDTIETYQQWTSEFNQPPLMREVGKKDLAEK